MHRDPTPDERLQEKIINKVRDEVYRKYSQSIDMITTRLLQGRFFDWNSRR